MIRKRLGRLATIFTSASLLLALAGVGSVTAATPNWLITYDKLPNTVSAGNDAGYSVTVENQGPSNINALTLTVTPASTPNATPSYFSGLTWNMGGPGSCTDTGKLVCTLGTVTAGTSITFTVAYAVPSTQNGTFDVTFSLRAGTGDTGSDGKGKSRGDKYDVTAKSGVANDQNLDAGFVVDELTYQTTGNLGRNNKQATILETTDTLIPVTVEDGIPDYPCAGCANLIGEWSVLNVNGGDNDDPIKVTILIWGGSVPGGVGEDDIVLLHADGSGGYTTISATCNANVPPTNLECLESVTKVGSNFKVVAWLAHNGGLRGGY